MIALAAGGRHACSIDVHGIVWCWGDNAYGQVDPSEPGGMLTPRRLPLSAPAISLASGRRHTCALTAGGAVWCWGSNEHGALGDGTTVQRPGAVVVDL